jgi:hypothetical protein
MQKNILPMLVFILLISLPFGFSISTGNVGLDITNNYINSSNVTNIIGVGTVRAGNSSLIIQNGTVTNISANMSYLQARVSDTCASGSSIRVINQDGTVVCETDSTGSGTVTSILFQDGLYGGTVTTTGTVGINYTQLVNSVGNYSSDKLGIYNNISAKGTGNITGSGISGNISYWTNSTNLASSILFQTGNNLGLNTVTPNATLSLISSNRNGSLIIKNTSNEIHFFINGSSGQASFGNYPQLTKSGTFQDITSYFQIIGRPPRPSTTATGNDADNVLTVNGSTGGNTTIATTGTGGFGSSIEFNSGKGGLSPNAVTSSTGGQGGAITFIPADGGSPASTTITATGGRGGFLNFFSGNGGIPTAGNTRIGGAGGGVNLFGGNGGASTMGSGAGGNGGGFTLSAGLGGNSINGTAGRGGSVSIGSSSGATSTNGAGGQGGDITISSGRGGAGVTPGVGGHIYIGSVISTRAGNIILGRSIAGNGINNNVSIGVAVPISPLHLDRGTALAVEQRFTAGSTTGATVGDGLTVGITATGEAQIRQYENNNITFYTNNSEKIRLTNSGRLGIGTVNPSATLQVSATSGNTPLYVTGSASNAFIELDADQALFLQTKNVATSINPTRNSPYWMMRGSYWNGSQAVNFDTNVGTAVTGNNTGYLFLKTANTNRLIINQIGNVGINTTAPTQTLHVSGIIRATQLRLDNGTNQGVNRCNLVGGTCTISNTAVSVSTNILCMSQTTGGTLGSLSVSTRTAGVSYTINSSSALDTSTVACMLIEPN